MCVAIYVHYTRHAHDSMCGMCAVCSHAHTYTSGLVQINHQYTEVQVCSTLTGTCISVEYLDMYFEKISTTHTEVLWENYEYWSSL